MEDERLQTAWRDDRTYLLAIARRMLRRPTDAEDVVQEAYARLAIAPVGDIIDLRAWLAVVVRRLCLDRLGSAHNRHEASSDVIADRPAGDLDPVDRLTLDDEVSLALSVVLDRLSPAERTSFVLHDIFDFPFDAVGEMVGRTPVAVRQLASRARQSIRASGPAVRNSSPAASRLAERFIAACAGGDVHEVMALLDPDVVGLATMAGRGPLPVVRGPEGVAQRTLVFFGPSAGVELSPFAVEESAGILAHRNGRLISVVRLDERGGAIHHLHAIVRL